MRIRGNGFQSIRWDLMGTITPSPAIRRALVEHLRGYTGKIRIESLDIKSVPIGTVNYHHESTTMVPSPAPAPAPAVPPVVDAGAYGALTNLVHRLTDMFGTVTKSNADLVESIRKSKSDAPDFFVALYKSSLDKIEELQTTVLQVSSERDVALTLLQKTKENPAQAHALVEGLRELKGLANTAVPTVQQLLQKLVQSLLEGKTQDLVALFQEQSMSSRVKIVVGLTLAGVEATPMQDRQEFLMRCQDDLKKGLGLE